MRLRGIDGGHLWVSVHFRPLLNSKRVKGTHVTTCHGYDLVQNV